MPADGHIINDDIKRMPANKPPTKPELLAPAGSLESFNAAIEAGADAVYLGTGEFNARLRARNFTVKSLSYLITQAHIKGVKVYITVNTVIKQDDLKIVLDLLYQLQQLGVDAVIVQDLGVAYLAKQHFPDLEIHASTQMVIHNRLGLNAAHRLGIKRAVLSRELSLEEIEQLQRETPIELEVFIHGALCYCISGLCLASSFLGGWSGNRGRCTQVCRRRFNTKNDSGYYFSPKDLWAVDHIPAFASIGLASLKIEGRMKSAEYVYRTVDAYRKLLDSVMPPDQIKQELSLDLGRGKTRFFLDSADSNAMIVSRRPSGTGIPIGTVSSVSDHRFCIRSEHSLSPGDRLRLHNQQGHDGTAFVIKDMTQKDGQWEIEPKTQLDVQAGDQLYLISPKGVQKSHWKQIDNTIKPVRYRSVFPRYQQVLKSLNPKQHSSVAEEQLYVKVDTSEWLNILKGAPIDYLILTGGLSRHSEMLNLNKQLKYWSNRLIVEFPPFISDSELEAYQSLISQYSERGIAGWMASHFSHALMFPEEGHCFSDTMVWTTNRATQAYLISIGIDRFSYSLEDDVLNLKATHHPQGIMPIFGHVPLFISKIRPAAQGAQIRDDKGAEFFIREREGLFYTLSEQPICFFHRRQKLNEIGINSYSIDLSFIDPSRKFFKTLLFEYQARNKLQHTSLFNHKAGLK